MAESCFTNIEDCIDLLAAKLEVTKRFANQLDELLDDRGFEGSLDSEPIRMIHHLSCTGGTLFSKCIASMPNVLILNEINPFILRDLKYFAPSDMVALIKQGDLNFASHELIAELLLAGLEVLRKQCWLNGRVLVLRDHSNSQFLKSKYNPNEPILREVIAEKFPVISLITTRDRENAFRSMKIAGWDRHISPNTFEEYERRHEIFLDRFTGVPVIRYEDFCAYPKEKMQEICEILKLGYYDNFEEVFHTFKLSGDSGRGGRTIISGR